MKKNLGKLIILTLISISATIPALASGTGQVALPLNGHTETQLSLQIVDDPTNNPDVVLGDDGGSTSVLAFGQVDSLGVNTPNTGNIGGYTTVNGKMLVKNTGEIYAPGGGILPDHAGALYIFGATNEGFGLKTTIGGGMGGTATVSAEYVDNGGVVAAPNIILDQGSSTWDAADNISNGKEFSTGTPATVELFGTAGEFGTAMTDGQVQPLDLALFVKNADPEGDWASVINFTAVPL